jgi:hypothetical protein
MRQRARKQPEPNPQQRQFEDIHPGHHSS